ncbi:hypothetical protein [Aquibacillus sediminis]|uniref:hypothetical protein n=1 Tax=Aquibacillus sediminis TaxID=2574734 RepID=UPI001107C485|nr:hypothetical protein [Aquibacillus sediminis]
MRGDIIRNITIVFLFLGILFTVSCSEQDTIKSWKNVVEGEYWTLEYTMEQDEFSSWYINITYVINDPNEKMLNVSMETDMAEPLSIWERKNLGKNGTIISFDKIENRVNKIGYSKGMSLSEMKQLLKDSSITFEWGEKDNRRSETLHFIKDEK